MTRLTPATYTILGAILLAVVGFSDWILPSGALTTTPTRIVDAMDELVIEPDMRHLRNGDAPEWTEFESGDPGGLLVSTFQGTTNASPVALELTQYDVRRAWRILLNGEDLGALERDEQLMTIYRAVPAGLIQDGSNELEIRQDGEEVDDIRVGRITLHDRPVTDVIGEGSVMVRVTDAESHARLPSRLTIVDGHGALQTVGGQATDASNRHVAVRPGNIYAGMGEATFALPAGTYRIYASRGFEYGVDSVDVHVQPGSLIERDMAIRREVPTEGWAAMDTHVHTLTHSGHGDATEAERVLTLAGEGVELPVITDHNTNVDLRPLAVAMGYDTYFTPVVGNEYTTPSGHFNLFPVPAGGPLPEPDVSSWDGVSEQLEAVGRPDIVVLNHARNTHGGFRPFGPRRYVAAAGMPRDGVPVPANAMEVVNSSAQQHDVLRLVKDWLGATNAGAFLAPVGSSDSHDVSRYLVGQGRTYVRMDDDAPGRLDTEQAVASMTHGSVVASFGLLPMIAVNGSYGPGDLVPASGEVEVDVRVLAPRWLHASSVALYVNGLEMRVDEQLRGGQSGEKGTVRWTIPLPDHDVFLAAVAVGPGDTPPFWPVPKPYQRESADWTPHLIGVTGAVWVDVDSDGRPTPARTYAERLVDAADGDLEDLAESLAAYDEAVAVQAAAVLYQRGLLTDDFDVEAELADAPHRVLQGFRTFIDELRSH
ncbi:MAG: CehA/McbA family metallohydrolase [Rhodothermales bacterium]